MAAPSVTYTFANSTTADATQVNQNYTDLVNALSDGTKDISVAQVTAAGKFTASAAFVTSGVSTVVATNGSSSTVGDTTAVVILAPAGTIAGYTLTLPANPSNGQRLSIVTNGSTITSLTLAANTGHALATGTLMTTLVAGMSLELVFASNTWYRIAGVSADGTGLEYSGGTLRLKDGGVTIDKRAAVNEATSSGCGVFDTSASHSTFQDVTNLSVSFTATGRRVVVVLEPVNGLEASIACNGGTNGFHIKILRGATDIGQIYAGQGNGTVGAATWTKTDKPAAGTYTYKVQIKGTNNTQIEMANYQLTVYEVG
jgi:hypothetical protein